MELLDPGYFQSNYFSAGYWQEDYWQDYGVLEGKVYIAERKCLIFYAK